MPKVGKQKFPYTSGGVQKAQKHAKETGQKVDMSGYKKGGKVRAGRIGKCSGRRNITTVAVDGKKAQKRMFNAGESGYKSIQREFGTTSKGME